MHCQSTSFDIKRHRRHVSSHLAARAQQATMSQFARTRVVRASPLAKGTAVLPVARNALRRPTLREDDDLSAAIVAFTDVSNIYWLATQLGIVDDAVKRKSLIHFVRASAAANEGSIDNSLAAVAALNKNTLRMFPRWGDGTGSGAETQEFSRLPDAMRTAGYSSAAPRIARDRRMRDAAADADAVRPRPSRLASITASSTRQLATRTRRQPTAGMSGLNFGLHR